MKCTDCEDGGGPGNLQEAGVQEALREGYFPAPAEEHPAPVGMLHACTTRAKATVPGHQTFIGRSGGLVPSFGCCLGVTLFGIINDTDLSFSTTALVFKKETIILKPLGVFDRV